MPKGLHRLVVCMGVATAPGSVQRKRVHDQAVTGEAAQHRLGMRTHRRRIRHHRRPAGHLVRSAPLRAGAACPPPTYALLGWLCRDIPAGRPVPGLAPASPPIDFHVTDTYFVVAHFHYVLFGTIVFATYAGIYFWFPKTTGRLLDERLGKLHFWLTFVAFHTTLLVQHWLGDEGMPRRYADYLPTDGFTTLNVVYTTSARSSSRCLCLRSCGTCSRVGAAANPSPSMIPGVTATRWSGPPAARRRGTTSPNSRIRSERRPLNCTTHTWWSGVHIGRNHTEVHS